MKKVLAMDKGSRNIYFNIVYTLVMALCIALIMIITYREITNLAVEDCFQKLWDQTGRMRDELKNKIDSDTRLLETISVMLAELPDMEGEAAQKLLDFERTGNLVEKVELLLPDGRILGADGFLSEANRTLDYDAEAAQGAHFTGKLQSGENSEELIVYNIIPVVQGNETAALLCGRISLTELNKIYSSLVQANGSCFYLIDTQQSELLIDTMHEALGKPDLSYKARKHGDGIDTVISNMNAGIPGELSFYSDTVQTFLYGVYMPVGIRNWVVMLGIPESIAFDNVNKINVFFFGCAVLEALVLVIYFIALLSRSRKMADELKEQYRISQRLRQIQEKLFHSVLRPEQMVKALEEMADLLTAKRIYLHTDLLHNESKICCYMQPGEPEQFSQGDFPALLQFFMDQGQIFFSDVDELAVPEAEKERLRQAHIRNGMGIILEDSDNHYQGILLALNMTKDWKEEEPLEWLRFDLSMALDNMEAFQRIRDLGSKDQLTGLLNRNSYQKAMEFYEKTGEDTLNCVYIDVDGLHELNNRLGHTEGDRMLTTIARFLQEIFGDGTVYRIGGDEFLIFCQESGEKELERKLKDLRGSVADAGYHISMGVSDRRETPLVYEMVRLAESRMYEAKRQYYRERKNGEKVREMNHQLEATLLEKRDLDAFCSVLAYKYVGVYIVNLSLDTTRSINIPDYFETKLERTGGKYSEAIKLYAEELIVPEYRPDFLALLDYEKLFRQLLEEERPELCYRKQDGRCILLKIYPTPDFDEFQKECIWTFEAQGAEQ